MNSQRVVVTGVSGSIGAVIARLFPTHGANVSLHYYPFSVNATDEQAVKKDFEDSCNHFELVNVCIVNRDVFKEDDIPILDMFLDQWQNTINVDLTSYFLYAREWCRPLKYLQPANHDNINATLIAIGSVAGNFGRVNHIDYATAKGALQSCFIKSLKK
ncbi:unnamed protein product [Rotaria socialis]|uniref:Uncharacterized protein n=1 Tax=Rotaria socialis TaxID=392032 RepID=A0A820K107_9BILA|nr:unnamed protein product [Rotaria socialis]